jgi:hypothetical protein
MFVMSLKVLAAGRAPAVRIQLNLISMVEYKSYCALAGMTLAALELAAGTWSQTPTAVAECWQGHICRAASSWMEQYSKTQTNTADHPMY